MNIRIANKNDASRIAEIYVFNNRVNYYPIFKDIVYSFKHLNVYSILNNYLLKNNVLDTFFQNKSIGKELIKYAVDTHNVSTL